MSSITLLNDVDPRNITMSCSVFNLNMRLLTQLDVQWNESRMLSNVPSKSPRLISR